MDIIEVIEGGFFTTVQDLGRYGYQRYGVPVSGALDSFALRMANLLVGNQEGDACLEVTLVGARLRFLADTVVAITGADLGQRLNDRSLPLGQAVAVPEGGILSFTEMENGMRAYMSVAGGISVPLVLGSCSTYIPARLGGVEGRALMPGDRLPTSWKEPVARVEGRKLPLQGSSARGQSHALRVVLGPQEDAFTPEGIQTFLSSTYTVTSLIDRIGYRLQGPPIQHRESADIVSDGIPFGAVQVTGDGMPIVLLADRGTTGGYTKIATIITVDISALAQATSGDTVTFSSVDLEEAHQALKEQEAVLQQLRSAPARLFVRQGYRMRVNGIAYEVATSLQEVAPGIPVVRGSPRRETVWVTIDGETHTLDLDAEAPESC